MIRMAFSCKYQRLDEGVPYAKVPLGWYFGSISKYKKCFFLYLSKMPHYMTKAS
jgi:hypothetical protein